MDNNGSKKPSKKVFSLQALLSSKNDEKIKGQKENESLQMILSSVPKEEDLSMLHNHSTQGQHQDNVEEKEEELKGDTSWVSSESPILKFLGESESQGSSNQQELLSHLFPEGFGVMPPPPPPPPARLQETALPVPVPPPTGTLGCNTRQGRQTIEHLQAELHTSKRQEIEKVEQLQAELQSLRVELEAVKDQAQRANHMAEEAKQETELLEEQKTALEKKFKAKEKLCTQQDSDLQELRENSKKETDSNTDLKNKTRDLEDEIHSLKDSLKVSEAKRQQLEQACATNHAQVNRLTRSVEALKQERDQLKNSNAEKQDRIQDLLTRMKGLEYSENNWKKKAADTEHRLAYLQNSLHRKEMQRKDVGSVQVGQEGSGGPTLTVNFNSPVPPPPTYHHMPKIQPPRDSAKQDIFPVGSNLDAEPTGIKGTARQPWETPTHHQNTFPQIPLGTEEDNNNPEVVGASFPHHQQKTRTLHALLAHDPPPPEDYGSRQPVPTSEERRIQNKQTSLRSLADFGMDKLNKNSLSDYHNVGIDSIQQRSRQSTTEIRSLRDFAELPETSEGGHGTQSLSALVQRKNTPVTAAPSSKQFRLQQKTHSMRWNHEGTLKNSFLK